MCATMCVVRGTRYMCMAMLPHTCLHVCRLRCLFKHHICSPMRDCGDFNIFRPVQRTSQSQPTALHGLCRPAVRPWPYGATVRLHANQLPCESRAAGICHSTWYAASVFHSVVAALLSLPTGIAGMVEVGDVSPKCWLSNDSAALCAGLLTISCSAE